MLALGSLVCSQIKDSSVCDSLLLLGMNCMYWCGTEELDKRRFERNASVIFILRVGNFLVESLSTSLEL